MDQGGGNPYRGIHYGIWLKGSQLRVHARPRPTPWHGLPQHSSFGRPQPTWFRLLAAGVLIRSILQFREEPQWDGGLAGSVPHGVY